MTIKDLSKLKQNDNVQIFTELVVREDSNTLYGFSDLDGKKTFNILLKVSGVGPKMAMAILEQFSFSDLQLAIKDGEPAVFRQVSGVGNKLAQKIILELKGSVDLTSDIKGNFLNNAKRDAISGLENLGYKRADVSKFVSEIDSNNTAEIIKLVLKGLVK
jgi:Holliday junction DNA helicase RuvA